MHDIDRTGVIFYTQISRSGIGCWNTNKPLTPQNFHFLTGNNRTMIYPSDLSVSQKSIDSFRLKSSNMNCFSFQIDRDGHVWMYTNQMPRWIYSQMNWNDYNFRLWRGNVNELVRNTPCESRGGGHNLYQ